MWIVCLDVWLATASKDMSFFSLQLNKFKRKDREKKMMMKIRNFQERKIMRKKSRHWVTAGLGDSGEIKMKRKEKKNKTKQHRAQHTA